MLLVRKFLGKNFKDNRNLLEIIIMRVVCDRNLVYTTRSSSAFPVITQHSSPETFLRVKRSGMAMTSCGAN